MGSCTGSVASDMALPDLAPGRCTVSVSSLGGLITSCCEAAAPVRMTSVTNPVAEH